MKAPVWLKGRTGAALGAVAAGLACALAHPPFGLLPGLLGYGAIMWLASGAPNLKSAFWRGWLAGTAYFAVGCWWVVEAFMVDAATFGWLAPFGVSALAGGLALFWAVAALIFRAAKPEGPLKVVLFAGLLSILEFLRGHLLTGFPWNLPGETWEAGGMLSQAASLFGVYGLTWLTVAISATPVLVVENLKDRTAWAAVLMAAITLGGLYAFGWIRLQAPAEPQGPPVAVRLVQPNLTEQASYDEADFQRILRLYLDLTRGEGGGESPDIVFWPEGALPASLNRYLADTAPERARISAALDPGQRLVLGGYRYEGGPENPSYFNSMVTLERTVAGLEVVGVYDKYRLVPFGEYMPGFLKAIGLQQFVPVSDGFTSGPPPQPLDVGDLKLQPLICYEALFPGFTRRGEQLSGERADLIVNLSNDGWFGLTSGPLQHFNMARYRAIEAGLPMVRSTPNGVSSVVSARGQIAPESTLWAGVSGVVDASVYTVQFSTAYQRFGETLFGAMSLISLLAFWAMKALTSGKKRTKRAGLPASQRELRGG